MFAENALEFSLSTTNNNHMLSEKEIAFQIKPISQEMCEEDYTQLVKMGEKMKKGEENVVTDRCRIGNNVVDFFTFEERLRTRSKYNIHFYDFVEQIEYYKGKKFIDNMLTYYKNVKNKNEFKKMCINIPPLYKFRGNVLYNVEEKANQYLLVYKNNKPAAYLAYKLRRAGTLDEEKDPITIDHYYIAWEASNPKGNAAVNRALKLCVLAKAIDDNVKSVTLDLCGGHFFSHPAARKIDLDFGFRYEYPEQTSAKLRNIINKNLTEDWGVLTDEIQGLIRETCHSSYHVKMAREVLKNRK